MRNLLPLLLLTLTACSTPFRPERPHPSAARMQELLDAPVVSTKKPVKASFEVRVSSRFANVGSDTFVNCNVPERYGVGRIRYGIEDVRMHEGPLDQTQNRLLVQNLPCGTLTASCVISTAKGIERTADVEIEVKGGMCEPN